MERGQTQLERSTGTELAATRTSRAAPIAHHCGQPRRVRALFAVVLGAAAVAVIPGAHQAVAAAPASPLAGGQILEFQVTGRAGIPTNAAAAVLNITAVDPTNAGYMTVYPCGQPTPNASNLNYQPGQTIPNLVIAKPGTNGKVCIYTSTTTDILADTAGYLPTGTYHPNTNPQRILDTRTTTDPFAGLQSAPVPSLCGNQPGRLVGGDLPAQFLTPISDPESEVGPAVWLRDDPSAVHVDLDGNGSVEIVAPVLCTYESYYWPQSENWLVAWTSDYSLLSAVEVWEYPESFTASSGGLTVTWITCVEDILVCIPVARHEGQLHLAGSVLTLDETSVTPIPVN